MPISAFMRAVMLRAPAGSPAAPVLSCSGQRAGMCHHRCLSMLAGDTGADSSQQQASTTEVFKVVYNNRHGGFSLSKAAEKILQEGGVTEILGYRSVPRDHPALVEVVEQLGEKSFGKYAKLEIETLPLKYKDCWNIREYDGEETVLIDFNKYRLVRIRSVLSSNCSEQGKLASIAAVLDEPDTSMDDYM